MKFFNIICVILKGCLYFLNVSNMMCIKYLLYVGIYKNFINVIIFFLKLMK